MSDIGSLMKRALDARLAIPAFNIPYLPMMAPVVQALRDTAAFGQVAVARLEWEKFEAGGLEDIRREYDRVKDERYTRLHLDHVPAIDEDNLPVDYAEIIGRAIGLGYDSVMIDGSRLPLDENIRATRRVVDIAHAAGVPVEAELGAILGHESGETPPYNEMLRRRWGFTDPDDARRFVAETEADWLSVAIGNIHGAIAASRKDAPKVSARLDIEHLARIQAAAGIPLVLHGGTGISADCLRQAIANGIAKVNIATAIRQPYEAARGRSIAAAQQAVYSAAVSIIQNELAVAGSARTITG